MELTVTVDEFPDLSRRLAADPESVARIELRQIGDDIRLELFEPDSAQGPEDPVPPQPNDVPQIITGPVAATSLQLGVTALLRAGIRVTLLAGTTFFPVRSEDRIGLTREDRTFIGTEVVTRLACGASKVVASGKATGSKRYPSRGGPAAQRVAIRLAYAAAWAKAAEAMRSLNVICADGCQLQLDVAFGAPKIFDQANISLPLPKSAPIQRRVFAEIPFELTARCTKKPEATGTVTTGKGPFTGGITGVARSCAGYAVGDVAEGVSQDATPRGEKISPAEALALAKQRAIERARAQIEGTLADLPHCPGISCPKETIIVKIGPFSTTVEPIDMPTLNMTTSTIARVPWRIQLSCSK